MVLHCEEEGLVLRTSEHVPEVVKQVLTERGWIEYDEESLTKTEGSWNLWWKTQRFRKSEHEEIAPWQRLNHFPRTDAITRKDSLVRNLRRMRCVHGTQVFNFHPAAYILPNEYTKFVSDYAKESQKNAKKGLYWICKPVDLSRGRGIFVFHDLKHLTYDCSVIVQRYVTNPFLISGYKFDLRIYVCVPSFQPLTIYMYQEGIVRFSTDKFDLNQLNNVFSHLTNTSINKYGPSYATDKERVGPGCKWTLSQLRSYLRQMDGVDETLLWHRISNIVTFTLATQAPSVPKCRNCFEVFGFDILVDDQMKPWLLEVNFSPALSMDCQADFIAKRSMLNDLIDLLNFKESDSEHGGKRYQDCVSPTPSMKRSLYGGSTDIYSLRRSNSRSPGTRIKTSVSKKSNSQAQKKGDPHCLIETIEIVKKDQTKRKKSLSKTNNSAFESNKKASSTLTLPQIRRNSSESLESSSSSSHDGFPRNLSSSSVSSSVSSIDHSNQPENAQELSNEQTGKNSAVYRTEFVLSMQDTEGGDNNNSILNATAKSPRQLSTITEDKINTGNEPKGQVTRRFSSPQNATPKTNRSKKNLNSAPVLRKVKTPEKPDYHKSSAIKAKLKTSNYKSPYSISSTATKKTSSANPWPRTRVGDFILTFPINEATRKASGTNYDMKTIIREQQKILKKLVDHTDKRMETRRKNSTSFTKSEAIHLSFQLKFDEKDMNPLYFWGPQNPPLLSNVLS